MDSKRNFDSEPLGSNKKQRTVSPEEAILPNAEDDAEDEAILPNAEDDAEDEAILPNAEEGWVNGPDESEDDDDDEDYVPKAVEIGPGEAEHAEAYDGDEDEAEPMHEELIPMQEKEMPRVVIDVSEEEFAEMRTAPITLLNRGLAALMIITAYTAGMINTYNAELIMPMGETELGAFRATLATQFADTMTDASQFEIDETIQAALQYGMMWNIHVGGEEGTMYTLLEFHNLLRGNSPAYDLIGTGMDTINTLIDTGFHIGGTFRDAFAGLFGGQINLSAAGESIAYTAYAVVFALMLRTAYRICRRTGAHITVDWFVAFIRDQISPITMIVDTVLARVLIRTDITDEQERFWIGDNDWPYPENLGYNDDGDGHIDKSALHADVTSTNNNFECLHSQSQSQEYGDVDGVQAMFDMASELLLNAADGTTSHNIVENIRYGCNMMSGLIARCTQATVSTSSLLRTVPDKVIDGTVADKDVNKTKSDEGASQVLAQILTEMKTAEAETNETAETVMRMLSDDVPLRYLATGVEPRLTAPSLTAPSLTAPSLTAPSLTAQRLTAQRLTAQRLAAQRLAAPSLTAPSLTVPSLTPQRITAPSLTAPSLTAPSLTLQSLTSQSLTAPRLNLPPPNWKPPFNPKK